MDKQEWLKSLKPGDKVANKDYTGLDRTVYYAFYTIKNLTTKGNIRLENGDLLDANGQGRSKKKSVTYSIEPITKEILTYEKERHTQTSLYLEVSSLLETKSRECRDWTIEDLNKIKDALNEVGIEKMNKKGILNNEV